MVIVVYYIIKQIYKIIGTLLKCNKINCVHLMLLFRFQSVNKKTDFELSQGRFLLFKLGLFLTPTQW